MTEKDRKRKLNELAEKMKPEHLAFCIEYVKTKNGKESYKKAYNNPEMYWATATSCASRLLKNVNVKEYLRLTNTAIIDDSIATVDELKTILTNDIRNDDAGRTNKNKSIELLGKMSGAFAEIPDTNINVSVNLPEELKKLSN